MNTVNQSNPIKHRSLSRSAQNERGNGTWETEIHVLAIYSLTSSVNKHGTGNNIIKVDSYINIRTFSPGYRLFDGDVVIVYEQHVL